MANDSFQNELPPSRVNIRYMKDTGDAREKVEIPHRVVVMGKFSNREDDTEVGELEKINIDAKNIDSVMEDLDISLDAVVPSRLSTEEDAEMRVKLKFKRMKDFRPESVVEQVPELNALVKIRGLLTDLKARVINNREFRKALETVLKEKKLVDDLLLETGHITVSEKEGFSGSDKQKEVDSLD